MTLLRRFSLLLLSDFSLLLPFAGTVPGKTNFLKTRLQPLHKSSLMPSMRSINGGGVYPRRMRELPHFGQCSLNILILMIGQSRTTRSVVVCDGAHLIGSFKSSGASAAKIENLFTELRQSFRQFID